MSVAGFPPVGTDGRVVGDLVVVDFILALLNEPVLLPVGPDASHAQHRLLEVGVDGGTRGGLQSLQLPRGGHVEPLEAKNKNNNSVG